MRIEFEQEFALPVEEVYAYFRKPEDWPRLYGSFGCVQDRGGGWYAVPLRRFPFPLLARVTRDEPPRWVQWEFGGFWRGEGEVRFRPTAGGVAVQGFESISVRPLGWLSRPFEKLFLQSRFERVWESGWRRLRKLAQTPR